MSIGSVIKQLRRERDITQEQLAEYLGITSRAVSQWECDRTAPDISQLPALCHIFDVSADVLLGIDIEKNEETIREYLENARKEEKQGNFVRSAEILREANQRYPKSYQIMQRLATAIVCVNSRSGIPDYEEVYALCRRVLAECTDSIIRYEAADTLGTAYGYARNEKNMRELAEQMPHTYYSYEDFMLYRWKGDADFTERQEHMAYLIMRTIEMIDCTAGHLHDDGTFVYSINERICLWKLEISLLEMIYSDGDYHFAAQFGERVCHHLVMAYLNAKDMEATWHWLEKCADFAIHMDTYNFDAAHTSLLLRGYSFGGWIMEAEGNHSQQLLDDLLSDEQMEPIRADKRFAVLINRLKTTAKKA